MAVAARIDPKDYFSAEEWSQISMRSSWYGLLLVAHCWLVILGAGAVFAIWPNPLTLVLAVMVIGARQLGLAILMHDAAHRALHPNAAINDFVGEWLCGQPVGAKLVTYRNYHLQHHKFAQQAEDPDLVLSAPFPITRGSLWRKALRDLSGQTFVKQRTAVLRAKLKDRTKSGASILDCYLSEGRRLGRFLAINAGLWVALAALGYWWAWPVLWLLPMATWYPLVTRFRNIAEHALVAKDQPDPLRHARTTKANWLERAFIAPYFVNYHCEHHMFMHVPCWSLPRAHRMLEAKGVTPRMEIASGYPTVLALASAK